MQHAASARLRTLEKPAPTDVAKLLTAAAKAVEELPAVGVDPDAIDAAHGLAESLRRLGGFLQRTLSVENGVQATVRILLFGDTAVFGEQAAEGRALRTFAEDAAAKARKTRAVLSSRYGREFPPLDARPKKSR